jgi:hypothetical protein
MKKSLLVVCTLISLLICAGSLPVAAATLWCNGDLDYVRGLANEINTSITQAAVYDNFIVPSGDWTINIVWSNNVMIVTGITSASWEICSGVSAGNGGILEASGTGAATQTATGLSLSGFTEYTIQVAGLNFILGPGTYWLNVCPIDSGAGRSFNSTTVGANAIGQPAGNNGISFFGSTHFGSVFVPTSVELGYAADFSMGVGNVPLPPSLLRLAPAWRVWWDGGGSGRIKQPSRISKQSRQGQPRPCLFFALALLSPAGEFRLFSQGFHQLQDLFIPIWAQKGNFPS